MSSLFNVLIWFLALPVVELFVIHDKGTYDPCGRPIYVKKLCMVLLVLVLVKVMRIVFCVFKILQRCVIVCNLNYLLYTTIRVRVLTPVICTYGFCFGLQ